MQRNSSLYLLDKFRRAQQYTPKPKFVPPSMPKKHRKRKKIAHKPPHVKPQTSEVTFSLVNFIVSCFNSLTYSQKVGLIFFIMIGTAHAIELPKDILKNKSLKKICTGKSGLKTFNKPTEMRLDVNHLGHIVPESCARSSNSCLHDNLSYEQFYHSDEYKKGENSLNLLRANKDIEYTSWQSKIFPEARSIFTKLNSDQASIFENIVMEIQSLKNTLITAYHTKKQKGGNCGELKDVALYQILSKKLKHGFDVKIQFMHLMSSQSSERISDHAFLLLDSNIEDMDINHDRPAVQTFLSRVQGEICDKWNSLYDKFTNQRNGLYHQERYDSLIVKSITFDFKDFAKLSRRAQVYICKQLSEMNFKNEDIPVCSQIAAPR